MSLPEFAQEWMDQWQRAGRALAKQRARELREMTEEGARAATVDLLDLGARTPLPEHRLRWSGLVVQQALLHGKRPPS